MNPLTNVHNLNKINQRELDLGVAGSSTSWHAKYKDSAWIYTGGLPYDLTEGDILCVFSQYGEIVNINLVRDQKTGKSKGFCFICYEDQRSTILAVDNLNGFKLLGRVLRVDHVENYRQPKESGKEDEATKALRDHGCAPTIQGGSHSSEEEEELFEYDKEEKKKKKAKKEKKKKLKKEKNKKKKQETESERETDEETPSQHKTDTRIRIKQERLSPESHRPAEENSRHLVHRESGGGGARVKIEQDYRRQRVKQERDSDGGYSRTEQYRENRNSSEESGGYDRREQRPKQGNYARQRNAEGGHKSSYKERDKGNRVDSGRGDHGYTREIEGRDCGYKKDSEDRGYGYRREADQDHPGYKRDSNDRDVYRSSNSRSEGTRRDRENESETRENRSETYSSQYRYSRSDRSTREDVRRDNSEESYREKSRAYDTEQHWRKTKTECSRYDERHDSSHKKSRDRHSRSRSHSRDRYSRR